MACKGSAVRSRLPPPIYKFNTFFAQYLLDKFITPLIEDNGISISKLAEYCQCNAEEIANTPNASSVLPAIESGDMPLSSISGVMNLSSKYCAKKVLNL